MDSDNSGTSHYSIYDSEGMSLIRRGSLPMGKLILAEYLKKTFDYAEVVAMRYEKPEELIQNANELATKLYILEKEKVHEKILKGEM